MPRFEIIEAKPYYCGRMARRLRTAHAQAILALGIDTHAMLRARFEESAYRRAWLIDGELAGLGGVTGPALSSLGYVWLALTDKALNYPVEIVREARRQLSLIMAVKRELATTIIGGDEAARRFAVFLGFHVADDGIGRMARNRTERIELNRFVESAAHLRMKVADGYAVAMGYHGREAA